MIECELSDSNLSVSNLAGLFGTARDLYFLEQEHLQEYDLQVSFVEENNGPARYKRRVSSR